jgi:hypothetical protein
MTIELSRPALSIPAGRGRITSKGGNTTFRSLEIYLNDTGFLEATVSYRGGVTYTYPFNGGFLGELGAGSEDNDFESPDDVVRDGKLVITIGADARNFRVVLSNNTHLPSNLVSGEWTLRHLRRTRLG